MVSLGTDRVSLYRLDWFTNENVEALESGLAKGYCVAFNNTQNAIQACLELMGTREKGLAVIMSVASSPDEIAAVMRSGANPILLDIEEEYLQIDPKLLSEILPALEEDEIVPIMLLNKPVGDVVNPALLALIQNFPSIGVYRGFVDQEMTEEHFQCAFNIMDLTDMAGAGAIVFHPYQEQIKHLKLVRSGIMGLNSNMPETLAMSINEMLDTERDLNQEAYDEIVKKYEDSNLEVMPFTKFPSVIWVKVKDAKLTAAQLKSFGIDAQLAMLPLYDIPEIRKRWPEEPDYPTAEKLKNSFICVPSHIWAVEHTDKIIKIIGEINE